MIVLASGSPRRRELLDVLGVEYQVCAPSIDETLRADEPIDEAVIRLAIAKGRQVADSKPGDWVLAADTLVALDGVPLGKPQDEREATGMLQSLSGRWHKVVTGIALLRSEGPLLSDLGSASVQFRELSQTDIAAYVESGEPLDRAGSYAVQSLGGILVARLVGELSTVVGLTLSITARLLTQAAIPHRLDRARTPSTRS